MILNERNTRNGMLDGGDVAQIAYARVKSSVPEQKHCEYAGNSSRPKLLIVSRIFGASGQPWLHRQVVGMHEFKKELLCWERQNIITQPSEDVVSHVLTADPAPYDGTRRWLHRMRNFRSGNFYASVGQEKRQLVELLRRNRPDVILCYFGDIAMRLLPVAQAAGIPVVAYLHGDFQFLLNRWYRWSLARTVQQFAAVVVINPIEREWMIRHGLPEEKLHMIPCGAPTDVFRPCPQRREGPVRFVMVSRLSPAKGCEWSIRAFARVAQELPDSELHLYGDGPLRQQLEQIVGQLGLASQVRFHGWINETQLATVLPQYDIFLQHSLDKEGFGVSIVEAEACELPVVVTQVRGIVEHVVPGETGLFVPERDISAMASAMLKLALSPGLRQRLGKAGRQRAMRLYDSTLLTHRLETVLLDVVENRPCHIA